MIEGGSSVVEAMDRMIKLFWIWNIQYTTGCENFFKLINSIIFKLPDKPVPKSVAELVTIINRYKRR
jgi:hypothetical protein